MTGYAITAAEWDEVVKRSWQPICGSILIGVVCCNEYKGLTSDNENARKGKKCVSGSSDTCSRPTE